MTHQFEMRISQQMSDVIFRACKEVIQANYVMTFLKQTLTQVGTKKSSTACHQYIFRIIHNFRIYKNRGSEDPLAGSED